MFRRDGATFRNIFGLYQLTCLMLRNAMTSNLPALSQGGPGISPPQPLPDFQTQLADIRKEA